MTNHAVWNDSAVERGNGRLPSVLIIIGYYLPGFRGGGPARSIASLVRLLGAEFAFSLITADRDKGDKTPYPGLPADGWTQSPSARVCYVPPGVKGICRILRILRSEAFDLLYLNSLFSVPYSIVPLIAQCLGLFKAPALLLAPRGELSRGALSLKPLRKRCYILTVRLLNIHKRIVWHASTQHEREDIVRELGAGLDCATVPPLTTERSNPTKLSTGIRVVTGSDLVTVDVDWVDGRYCAAAKLPGRLDLVFLSRICPMKNLAQVLTLLPSIKGEVNFDVFGPLDDSTHWRLCLELASRLPANITFTYRGEAPPDLVLTILARYHLFILLTLGENFGHVIIEALAAGCPVLISNRTPWRDIEASGAGWDIPLEQPEKILASLQRAVDLDASEHALMAESARSLAGELTTTASALDSNRAVLTDATTLTA